VPGPRWSTGTNPTGAEWSGARCHRPDQGEVVAPGARLSSGGPCLGALENALAVAGLDHRTAKCAGVGHVADAGLPALLGPCGSAPVPDPVLAKNPGGHARNARRLRHLRGLLPGCAQRSGAGFTASYMETLLMTESGIEPLSTRPRQLTLVGAG
jgi:hypothetical protein